MIFLNWRENPHLCGFAAKKQIPINLGNKRGKYFGQIGWSFLFPDQRLVSVLQIDYKSAVKTLVLSGYNMETLLACNKLSQKDHKCTRSEKLLIIK